MQKTKQQKKTNRINHKKYMYIPINLIIKHASGSFRPLSRSPLSRFAHFPVHPESFRPQVVRPLSRSPLSRFAHFPIRPRIVSPPYKILFLVLLFRPQKWYTALIFLLIGDFSL